MDFRENLYLRLFFVFLERVIRMNFLGLSTAKDPPFDDWFHRDSQEGTALTLFTANLALSAGVVEYVDCNSSEE